MNKSVHSQYTQSNLVFLSLERLSYIQEYKYRNRVLLLVSSHHALPIHEEANLAVPSMKRWAGYLQTLPKWTSQTDS